MSGQALINWSALQNTAGLDISGTSISGLTTLNGQAVSSIGGSTWSTFPAIQTVDMSLNSLSNIGSNSFARVTGTFQPTDVASCQLWFDVADVCGYDVSAGTNILLFLRDKSGFARDASYTGTSNVTLGVPINGRSVAIFPNTPNTARFLTPTFTSSTTTRSCFWVMRWTNSNVCNVGGYTGIEPINNTTLFNFGARILRDGANNWSNELYVGGRGGVGANQVIDTTLAGPIGRTFVFGGTVDMTSGLRVGSYNGIDTSLVSTYPYPWVASDFYRIGNDMRGAALGELIMYSNAISTDDRKKVEGYLAWKWGVVLPSNHTYYAAPPTGTAVASNEPLAVATTDRYNNLSLAGSNTVSASLLRYLMPNQETAATYPLSSNDSGTLYRVGGVTTLTTLTLPTLALSNVGVFWNFQNTGTSNLSVTLAGTTDITSPVTIYPGATYTIHWTGSNYKGAQDKDAPVTVPDDYLVVTRIGGGERVSYYSLNGTDWTSNTTYDGIHKPIWTGSNWISPIRRSANGINWRSTSGSSTTNSCSTTAWSGKVAVFYDMNSSTLRTSADGSNWSTQSTGTVFTGAGTVDDITWGQDRFVAAIGWANGAYHYAYSFDASTWYAGGLIFPSNTNFVRPVRIRYNGSYWVAGGDRGSGSSGSTNLARSSDGVTWTQVGSVTNPVTGLEWNGDIWLAAAQGRFWTSPDGSNWTSNIPANFSFGIGCDIAWSGTYWYALGCNAAGATWAIIRSQDGSNWSAVKTFTDGNTSIFQPYIASRFATAVRPATQPTLSLVVTEVSGTSLTIGSNNSNRSFYLTNSGFNAMTLPTNVYGYNGGTYWSLRNATGSSLSITLTNTLNLTSPLIIPSSNTQTLVVSRDTSNTLLLL
jgi:hypothetical protein